MSALQKLSITTASAALIALGSIGSASAASLYSITELPFTPSDINDQSQVVGGQFLFNNGVITNLGTLPGASSTQANAINNFGQIVGSSGDRAFLWENGTITSLGKPPFCQLCYYTSATDINDKGQIVGNLINGDNPPQLGTNQAFFREKNGTATELAFNRITRAKAVNNLGQVVGTTGGPGGTGNFLYDSRTGSSTNPFPAFSDVNDINDKSQVVGRSYDINAPFFNFDKRTAYLSENGSLTNLGTLGGDSSSANGINNATQIVGSSSTTSGTQRAFLWETGSLFDLNSLISANSGWDLTSASKINNKDQIIGTGNFNGQQRGFLLTPVSQSVPEPTSTLGLLGLGALGIGSLLQRRKRHNP